MYHYYVRYTLINNGRPANGATEVVLEQKVSNMVDIETMKDSVLKNLKKVAPTKRERDAINRSNFTVIIDFYQLLRKDPD